MASARVIAINIRAKDEVLAAAAAHAVAVHGHTDSPELREMLRAGLQDAERGLA